MRNFLLLAVALLGLIICIAPENKKTAKTQVDPNFTIEATIEGEVVGISPVWTMNGDGGIVVLCNGKEVSVAVKGSASGWPETKVTLTTVKCLTDLLHKNVEISGIWHCGTLIAKDIKEK